MKKKFPRLERGNGCHKQSVSGAASIVHVAYACAHVPREISQSALSGDFQYGAHGRVLGEYSLHTVAG